MANEEAPAQDWRSVETRAADHVALGTARNRAAEPGGGAKPSARRTFRAAVGQTSSGA